MRKARIIIVTVTRTGKIRLFTSLIWIVPSLCGNVVSLISDYALNYPLKESSTGVEK